MNDVGMLLLAALREEIGRLRALQARGPTKGGMQRRTNPQQPRSGNVTSSRARGGVNAK